MVKIDLLEAVSEIAKENPDGFTISLADLEKVKKGIAVAYLDTQDGFGEEGLKTAVNHALGHDGIVGGWFNDDDCHFYFDSVRIFSDLDEAIRFGRENKQKSIFDIGNLRLIKL